MGDSMEKYKKLIIIGTILGIWGLLLVFFSVSFGTTIAQNWLTKQVATDTWNYELVMQSNINNFLVIGSILFTVGLVSILLSWHKTFDLTDK